MEVKNDIPKATRGGIQGATVTPEAEKYMGSLAKNRTKLTTS